MWMMKYTKKHMKSRFEDKTRFELSMDLEGYDYNAAERIKDKLCDLVAQMNFEDDTTGSFWYSLKVS